MGAGRRRARFPPSLLAPRPGERIADLCAAPGGKTAQLALSGAEVTAVERDPVRLARLAEQFDAVAPPREAGACGCPGMDAAGVVRRGAARRAVLGDRNDPASPGCAAPETAARHQNAGRGTGCAARGGGTDGASGRAADLRGVLVAARGSSGAVGGIAGCARSRFRPASCPVCPRRSRRKDFCGRTPACGRSGAAWMGSSRRAWCAGEDRR